MRFCLFSFLVCAFLSSCATGDTAENGISEKALRAHIEELASDAYAGRKPFTEGETKTLAYLEKECKRIGLKPGNGNSYMQDVPLVEIKGTPSSFIRFEGPQPVQLQLNDHYVVYTQRPEEEVKVENSEVVFCGYGIVAPEYNWNDYANVDVKGKTVIVLVNDPGLGNADSTFFKGNTMTYYGRWTYKYEEAARQGAAAIWIVHEATMAGYPWAVVQGAGSGAKLNLEKLDYTPCALQGWISLDAARELFQSAGKDLQKEMHAARAPGYTAVPLPFNVTYTLPNEVRRDVSKNVIAVLQGTEKPEEYIIFSAHWDHLGTGTAVDGDSIYNGALDNASGTAALLAIAESLCQQGPFKRSIAFLWVTAEEQGLLGSAYYSVHPIYAPGNTIANLNIDALFDFGEMKDLSVIGYGQSDLDEYARRAAEAQGRYVLPDQEPEKGYFFRSDHFNFARIGIPALYAKGSHEHMSQGKDFAKEKMAEYRTSKYHQPADEYDAATFDVSGMLQDATLFAEIAKELANSDAWPKWKEGSEFKAVGDARMITR